VQLFIDQQRQHYSKPVQFLSNVAGAARIAEYLRCTRSMASTIFRYALYGIASCLMAAAMPLRAAEQRAPDSDPVVPSVQDFRSIVDLSQAAQLKPVILGKQLPTARRANASATCSTGKPIQDITLDVDLLLTRAHSIESNSSKALFGEAAVTDRSSPLVTVPIEGQLWKLVLAGRTMDPSKGLVHVTALSLDADSDFARFTIDVASKIAVGTLVLRGNVYRIVPDSNEYAVYKLDAGEPHGPGRYRRVTQDCGQHVVSELELRHVQMEVLADVQPERVRVEPDAHYVLLQGGSLGSMPSTDEAVSVLEALRNLEPLVPTTKDTALRVTETFRNESTSDQARVIRFEQVIGGIPVERRNEIGVAADGRINEIQSSLVDRTVSALQPLISEDAALVRAREALASRLNNAAHIESTVQPELKYRFVKKTLVPTYVVEFSIDSGEHYSVSLDASSGATQILPMAVPAN